MGVAPALNVFERGRGFCDRTLAEVTEDGDCSPAKRVLTRGVIRDHTLFKVTGDGGSSAAERV